MSSYDTVMTNCPWCGHIASVQSKAGDCEQKNYTDRSVPLSVAGDLYRGEHECNVCRRPFKFTTFREFISLTPIKVPPPEN